MYEDAFHKLVFRNYKRESYPEPTEWVDITKLHLFYGDIRNNTLRKFYILARGGFVMGFWYASCETYLFPHPLNPAGGTSRFFALSLVKRVPVSMFASLSFGAYWYAWNTYFDNDNALGVIFASNAAWATTAGPVLKKWTQTYSFMPWGIFLGLAHVFPLRADMVRRRLTQFKISNPHHYEMDVFGNHVKPLTGINYDFDDEL